MKAVPIRARILPVAAEAAGTAVPNPARIRPAAVEAVLGQRRILAHILHAASASDRSPAASASLETTSAGPLRGS